MAQSPRTALPVQTPGVRFTFPLSGPDRLIPAVRATATHKQGSGRSWGARTELPESGMHFLLGKGSRQHHWKGKKSNQQAPEHGAGVSSNGPGKPGSPKRGSVGTALCPHTQGWGESCEQCWIAWPTSTPQMRWVQAWPPPDPPPPGPWL